MRILTGNIIIIYSCRKNILTSYIVYKNVTFSISGVR
jgi:hypothetical protein